MKPVKFVKVNNLQYNPNRDPQVYRVIPKQEFRIQAFLAGSGTAECSFTVEDKTFTESIERKDGIFECCFSFETAGIRLGQLKVISNNEEFTQDIRLDVMEHEWIG